MKKMVWIVTCINYTNLDWVPEYKVDRFVISPATSFNENNAHDNDDGKKVSEARWSSTKIKCWYTVLLKFKSLIGLCIDIVYRLRHE